MLSRVPLWTVKGGTPETTGIVTQAEAAVHLPRNSLKPFWLALALLVAFVGLLISLYLLAGVGIVLAIGIIIVWLWSSRNEREKG